MYTANKRAARMRYMMHSNKAGMLGNVLDNFDHDMVCQQSAYFSTRVLERLQTKHERQASLQLILSR
jgi:hypothetical protein